MQSDIHAVEKALLAQPDPQGWEAARALYKAAAPAQKTPELLRLYGLACVLCHPPEAEHFGKGLALLEQAAGRFCGDGRLAEAASTRLHQARAAIRARAPVPADAELVQLFRRAFTEAQCAESVTLQMEALHHLGLAYLGHRDIEKAESTLDELQSFLQPPSELGWRWHHLRSRILHALGEPRLAASELSQAWSFLRVDRPMSGDQRMLWDDAQSLIRELEEAP